jgi:ketosteroid isomerase-like protein
MPGDKVEVVREVYEAVGCGDSAAVLAAYHPEIEHDFSHSPLRLLFRRTVYSGHDGLRDFFRERYEEAWGTIEDVCEELIDAGGPYVVSVVRTHGSGRVSGAHVEIQHSGVWTIRDGKVAHVAWLDTREAALEAARAAGEERAPR